MKNPYLNELMYLVELENPTDEQLERIEWLRNEKLSNKPKNRPVDVPKVPKDPSDNRRIPIKIVWNGGYRLFKSKREAIWEWGISRKTITDYMASGEPIKTGRFKGFKVEEVEKLEQQTPES